MSLHLTPNEPDDWTNGPADEPEGPECGTCDGEGTITGTDGTANPCDVCGGTGHLPYEDDTDFGLSDFGNFFD